MLEHVGQLGKEARLSDQLQRLELVEKRVGTLANLRELVNETLRELATYDGGDLKRPLGAFRQPVDAGRDERLDRGRDDPDRSPQRL